MNKEQAYKIGLAFKLGMIYARGKAHARQLTNDDAKWITVHPNGKENKGRPALLDSETGEVLGGMGGKFTGRHISAIKQGGKFEQPGAQMQITARNSAQKATAMNNQRIDFKPVGGQSQTDRSAIEAGSAKELKKQAQKENATKTRTQNEQESITNADFKKYHMPLNQLAKIEKETDKAFLISSDFASGFDGDDIVYKKESVWVPKSQVSSKNGYVFGMNPKFAKENGFKTQRSRELAKRLRLPQNTTTTANKTLSANKNNGLVASVLNVPDASKWNNKIYNYRNGEKAVFINNQKIVLNAEQYKKLKELAGK